MNNSSCVSVRLRSSDIRKIKCIARRLGVSDSEIFRFGIRLIFSKMVPLLDENACGYRILPLFLDNDAELIRQFDMDITQLERIINFNCELNLRVESEDLNLLSLHNAQSDYLRARIEELSGEEVASNQVWDDLGKYLNRKYGMNRATQNQIDTDDHGEAGSASLPHNYITQ